MTKLHTIAASATTGVESMLINNSRMGAFSYDVTQRLSPPPRIVLTVTKESISRQDFAVSVLLNFRAESVLCTDNLTLK